MISIIIGFYKRLNYLELIFQSMEAQSDKSFEVIIAEDNDATETVDFINLSRKKYSFHIKHVSQPDLGFLKTKILNTAIKVANGDKLVFIDGDCILHKHFVKEYQKAINPSVFCYGRRAMISEAFTQKILAENSIAAINYFSLLKSGGQWMAAAIYIPWKINQHKQHRRILGCNWGVTKVNILKVNGFDEDYQKAGVGEDFDIDWRLKKLGIKCFSMKNKAIVYHMHHPPNYSAQDTAFVEQMMENKIKAGEYFCSNGIIKNSK